MKVTNEIQIYAIKGKERKIGQSIAPLFVNSDSMRNLDRVTLVWEGIEITVIADDLERAIRNATNVR